MQAAIGIRAVGIGIGQKQCQLDIDCRCATCCKTDSVLDRGLQVIPRLVDPFSWRMQATLRVLRLKMMGSCSRQRKKVQAGTQEEHSGHAQRIAEVLQIVRQGTGGVSPVLTIVHAGRIFDKGE